MMMVRLNELSNGIGIVIRFVFQLKQSIIEFLGEAKKFPRDTHDARGPPLSQHHPLS